MANIIPEPIDANPITEEWQKLIAKLTQTTAGLSMVGLTNISTHYAPEIAKGSRFEINGSYYIATQDEPVLWRQNNPPSGIYYIYAIVSSNGTCSFVYSSTRPVLTIEKGGFYLNNDRCLAVVTYTAPDSFLRKHVLASQLSLESLSPNKPVGYIYESMDSTHPSLLYGGTWTELAPGRVLIGTGATTDASGLGMHFNVHAHGGAYTHVLTEAELASHSHIFSVGVEAGIGGGAVVSMITVPAAATHGAGSNYPHNNIQPYYVVYRWHKTAN